MLGFAFFLFKSSYYYYRFTRIEKELLIDKKRSDSIYDKDCEKSYYTGTRGTEVVTEVNSSSANKNNKMQDLLRP